MIWHSIAFSLTALMSAISLRHPDFALVLAELKSFSIAASLALFLTIGGYWLSSKGDKIKEDFVKITAQESGMHLLPDNSKVWMEPGSSIKYSKSFTYDRKVWLEGNSLFEVSKHEGSTFQVYINKAYVEVKGTCFLIKQNSSDHNEITLINGSINFNIEAGEKSIPLKPMQRVIYNPLEGETEIKEIANLKWEDGKYLLNDMSLTQLIQTINQLYNTRIILTKDVNRKSAFTGTIRYDEPLTNVLNKICFSLNLNKEQVNDQIIIY